MNDPLRLDGRTLVITGAAQGIGLALGRLAIRFGACVVGVDLNEQGLKEAGLPPDRFLLVCGDVADPQTAQRAVQEGVSTFGAVHGLISNAGVTRPALIEKMTREQWQLVLDVHLTGSFYFMQAVGRHLIERARAGDKNPGSLILVSSDAGRRGSLGQINYSAAKAGMFGMAMTAAREWAKYNIRANAVCFGVVETAMTELVRTDERFRETYLAQIPLGRWSTPEEAATPVLFLLSDAASYITGQVISVNGGYTISV